MFFQKNKPDPITDTSSLYYLPLPFVVLVQKLEHIRNQAWLNGYQFIIYTHFDKSVDPA